MNTAETIRRYHRIAALLLAVADESDVHWAAQIIDAARHHRTKLSQGLVREAYNKRSIYRKDPDALRAVDGILAGELNPEPPAVLAACS